MVPTKDLRVKYVPIGDVRPYEDNPRRNDGAVQAVANSLREFGWKQPIVVDADGTIVVGHTRYKAALALEMTHVPVVVASDLTPEQCAAYRLADNRVGELAEWDENLLAVELDGLSDLDMSAFGFDDSVTEDMFGDDFSLPDTDAPQFKTVSLQMTAEMFGEFERITGRVEACRYDGGNDSANRVLEVLELWDGR